LAAEPALLEVDVLLLPVALLLVQVAWGVVPALVDVDVALPPMAVLLAQQALEAAAPEQALCTDVLVTAFSDFSADVAV
jgi:hypothetical protein